ncbi:MAG: DASS family sodium-coupled anion symporter [Balneolaceae bacterium]
MRSKIGLFLGPVLFFAILLIPGQESLTPDAQAVAAVAILMATWWITESIPMAAVALLPIALFPILGIMPTPEVTEQYGNHIIYLFMGGFLIAVTMERWELHRRIALTIIEWIGSTPSRIVLGFMIASAFLSMWVSNTATAMMMVPIGLAVIRQTKELFEDHLVTNESESSTVQFNFALALMLGIAYACSIGGTGTIIGTPPNTILVGVVDTMFGQSINFGGWMLFAVPLVVVMLFLCWTYLVYIAFPPGVDTLPGADEIVQNELNKLGRITKEEQRVMVIFGLTAIAWILNGFVHIEALEYINDSSIAITAALLLFLTPSDFQKGIYLLDWETASKIPWGIIVLFGGGLALAHGFTTSGLAVWIAESMLILDGAHIFTLLLAVTGLTIILTEVTSNTATSTMLMPILASLAAAMALHPYALMVAAAIAASFAFMLPVATPPNAVVFGSNMLTIPQMARAGIWLNLMGILVISLFVYLLLPLIWGIELQTLPVWAK